MKVLSRKETLKYLKALRMTKHLIHKIKII